MSAPTLENGRLAPVGVVEPSIVITRYAGDLGTLIGDRLAPVAAELQRRFGRDSVHLERHWLRGPHARIVLDDPALVDVARNEIAPRIAEYLTGLPVSPPISEADYLARSEVLGRGELVLGPYGPLRPDNSVLVEDVPVDQTIALIGADSYALKRRFLAAALTPLTLAHQAMNDGTHRTVLTLRLMALHCSRWPFGGLSSGYLTFKSHLEDFLLQSDVDGRLRAAYEKKFAANRAAYQKVFDDVLAYSTEGVYEGTDPYLAEWSGLLDRLWPVALDMGRKRGIEEDLGPGYRTTAARFDAEAERRWRFGDDRQYSEFHQALRKLNYLPQRTAVVEFAAYRNLTNQLLRWLPLLDVSPAERYFVSHVFAELVQDSVGIDWRARLSQDPAQVAAEVASRRPS